jgi:hypothetical protein
MSQIKKNPYRFWKGEDTNLGVFSLALKAQSSPDNPPANPRQPSFCLNRDNRPPEQQQKCSTGNKQTSFDEKLKKSEAMDGMLMMMTSYERR